MLIKDLRTAMKEAKAKWLADKTDKEARKAFRAAKAALTEAKEAKAKEQSNLKRQVEETNEKPARKKAKHNNPPSKRLFISNLSYDIDEQKCRDFFEDCGELVDFFWVRDKRTRQFTGNAIIEFATQEGADKGTLKSGKTHMGRIIRVHYSSPRPPPDTKKSTPKESTPKTPQAPSKRIFVGNISFDINDDQCREFFKDCGELVDIFWILDKRSQKFAGVGIVEFATQEQADKALLKNGEKLLGREINCSYAKPREEKPKNKKPKNKKGPKPMEVDDSPNPPSKRVFVGNLDWTFDNEQCKELFKDCGELVDIFWMINKRNKKFAGCGIIEFATQEGADKALSKKGTKHLDRELNIRYAKDSKHKGGKSAKYQDYRRSDDSPSEKYPGCDTVFVGNIFKDDDDVIKELFKECGKITRIKWIKNKRNDKFRGCGFISFDNPDVALPIAMAFHGTEFHGKELRIDYCKPR